MNDGWRKFDPEDEDTWPESRRIVMTYLDHRPDERFWRLAFQNFTGAWICAVTGLRIPTPNYWRPLPSPPEGE